LVTLREKEFAGDQTQDGVVDREGSLVPVTESVTEKKFVPVRESVTEKEFVPVTSRRLRRSLCR
jgi:hypothetical protein